MYDNSGETHSAVHGDLWRTKTDRAQANEYDIAGENLRKLISKDDSGENTGNPAKVSDGLMYSIHGTKQKLRLDRIIENHGLYAPFGMMNNFQYILTLPKATDIMVAQSGSTVGTYSLENIELEYETIENEGVASEASSLYSTGRSLACEHRTLTKTTVWDKDTVLVNENICLFSKTTSPTDSEEYLFPNIESVKVTIEGAPNAVYSQGIPKNRFYSEAKKVFNSVEDYDRFITIREFYNSKFALVIDLRAIEDNSRHGAGKKVINTQSGVLLEITKLATTTNVKCRIFVLSDGLVNFVNNGLKTIQY